MRKILLPAAAAALILASVAATPALACCSEEIEKLEKRIWTVPDNAQLQLGIEGMMASKMDKLLKNKDF